MMEKLIADLEFEMAPYCGRDPNTVSYNSCSYCYTHLCKVVYYCSNACKKDDVPNRENACKMVKQLTEEMKRERKKLLLLKAHHISVVLSDLASSLETVEAWQLVLGHQLELLPLIRGDNIGIHKSILPVLLYLNRDDDCMDFIGWWYRDYAKEFDEQFPESSPGDWIFGRNPDARLMDIFALHPAFEPKYFDLAFLDHPHHQVARRSCV